MNKPNLARIFKSVQTSVSKHSPEILTGFGIAGMITGVVLAVQATPKALELIEAEKQRLSKEEGLKVEKLTPAETIKAAWKPYIPTIVTTAASVACLVGASRVCLRRNAALAAAYKLSETALTEYREQVIETIGEKKEQVVREKVVQKQLDNNPVSRNEVYVIGGGDTIFLDPLSKRYFKSDIDRVKKAENALNKQMIHDICGTVTINEFYDELGLDHTDIGDELGWTTEHQIDLDITPGITDNGKPCLVIGHYNPPIYAH